MFSLSEARILDNDANESNFMTVFNQLTRLNLEGREMPIFDRDQENLATLSGNEVPSNPRMMTMGGTKIGLLEIQGLQIFIKMIHLSLAQHC